MEFGRWLFAQSCEFVLGVAGADQLPDASLPEVAFAGRSNVGKSSLVNALTGRKTLARVSNAPGRTRQLNFFALAERLMLVDLPGYGYAKVPRSEARRWTDLVEAYLRGRPNLRRVCLLIDARRGVGESDRELMAMLDVAAVPYWAVLTKCDKLSKAQLADLTDAIEGELARHGAAAPRAMPTSARALSGIAELRAGLAAISRD
ncbi:MAG: ribosome biogenesis GTP-binding protein YihA/YsxC [Rhodospirillales bacterium]|nr:ribosome biogenesis GTP-binding protein YihA/YsxC [Rhodospirillales bacterium]MDP6803844.1 ribosome biogenesis GTP-binding protein YihA/YsxC [Rhodospirillales bacterium]